MLHQSSSFISQHTSETEDFSPVTQRDDRKKQPRANEQMVHRENGILHPDHSFVNNFLKCVFFKYLENQGYYF